MIARLFSTTITHDTFHYCIYNERKYETPLKIREL